jgi:tRNA A37 threonylcarbamoyladenosine dehydratase
MADSDIFNRSELLLGSDVTDALSRTKVIIFGIGGVGSWCAEGLVRSGVGSVTLVDPDVIGATNVNRQLMATTSTIGRVKVEALRERLLDINPDVCVEAVRKAYCEDTAGEFDLDGYDYVIDSMDSLKDKILLILTASRSSATFFCSMGAALKVDPTKVKVAEFWQVRGCPLGAAIRKKMKRAGTLPEKKFLCVYDDEVLPNRGDASLQAVEDDPRKAQINGSLVPVTSIFGMTIAGLVVKDVYKRTVR